MWNRGRVRCSSRCTLWNNEPVPCTSYNKSAGQSDADEREGDNDNGVGVQVRPQTHSAPSFELRIADELVYATDTCFDAAAWKNVAPAKLLLHECWQTSPDDPRHTSAEALAAGLDRSRFGQIALLHLNPAWTDGQCDKVKRIAHAHGIELAYDGMVFEL